jgi:hypothetical protein
MVERQRYKVQAFKSLGFAILNTDNRWFCVK